MTDQKRNNLALLHARIVNYLGRSGAVDGIVERGVPLTEISFALGVDFDQCLHLIDCHCERPSGQRDDALFMDFGECNFVLNQRAWKLYEEIQSTCFMYGFRERIIEVNNMARQKKGLCLT